MLLDPLITETSDNIRQQAPRHEDKPHHRLRVRADGRCACRAVLAAAGFDALRQEDSREARGFICTQRQEAAAALVARMDDDDDFAVVVKASFPDEEYDTFELWLEAQCSDDTKDAISNLWRGTQC